MSNTTWQDIYQPFLWNTQLNEYQLCYTRCMKRLPTIKNCAKLFLFQCQIPKKNIQKLLRTFAFTALIIFRMWFWTQIPVSHVLLWTVFAGKGTLIAAPHWIILGKMHVFIKWKLSIVKESKGTRTIGLILYPKSRCSRLNFHFGWSPLLTQSK